MRAGLACTINGEFLIDELAEKRAPFAILRHFIPNPNSTSRWEMAGKQRRMLDVVVLGKAGHGKSALLNSLTGFPVFESSDVEACTRGMQSVEFRFTRAPGHCALSFTDLPGIGESGARDAEYLTLYEEALASAHVVVYVLRADQRDFSVDQRAFETLWLGDRKKPLTLALTCIDKIGPTNRSSPFKMTAAQAANLRRKVETVQAVFGLQSEQLVPVSAIEGIGLDSLATRIVSSLAPYLRRPVRFRI